MTGEEEEQNERPRPRVVDKRVSARASAPPADPSPAQQEATPAAAPTPEAGAAPSEPAPEPEVDQPDARAGDDVWTPEREAEAKAIAEDLARVPALDWVANAAVTMANVAAAKLQLGDPADAQLAIDAFGALVDGLGSRLGEAEQPLRQTLAQLRFAYSQAVLPPSATPGP